MLVEVWSVSCDFDDGSSDTFIELVIPSLGYVICSGYSYEIEGKIVCEPDVYELNAQNRPQKPTHFQKGFYYEYLGEL